MFMISKKVHALAKCSQICKKCSQMEIMFTNLKNVHDFKESSCIREMFTNLPKIFMITKNCLEFKIMFMVQKCLRIRKNVHVFVKYVHDSKEWTLFLNLMNKFGIWWTVFLIWRTKFVLDNFFGKNYEQNLHSMNIILKNWWTHF